MISRIHGITIVKTRRKDRKTNLEEQKLHTVIQYNKYKGVSKGSETGPVD